MKTLLVALLCLAATVSAAPDELLKPDEELSNTIDTGEGTPVTQEAPTEVKGEKKLTFSKQGTAEDRARLFQTLLKDYNKKVNPDNVTLQLGLLLFGFTPDLNKNILNSHTWTRLEWVDSRLKWEADEFGGCEIIRIDRDEIWTPDVYITNSADPDYMMECTNTRALIYNTGKTMLISPCKMRSYCNFNKKEPYGENTCSLKFGSWTFDGNVVDLQFYNNNSTVDTSVLIDSGPYEVVSTSGERNVKQDSCCVEPYPDLTYNITIRRLSGEELFKRM